MTNSNLILEQIKKTDSRMVTNMAIHYSQPKGFVGRNICYAILFNGIYYGTIVGGSATIHLVGRDDYFSLSTQNRIQTLNKIVNNIFFHIEKVDGKYPIRWFSQQVLFHFRSIIKTDWKLKYGDDIIGYETLVELPRTGQCYIKDGWDLVGQTKGYTCKRIGGQDNNEKFSGKRVWDYSNLRPKLVFCKKVIDAD